MDDTEVIIVLEPAFGEPGAIVRLEQPITDASIRRAVRALLGPRERTMGQVIRDQIRTALGHPPLALVR
jgi:hypothetical protein